jgi:hypothetical protein
MDLPAMGGDVFDEMFKCNSGCKEKGSGSNK